MLQIVKGKVINARVKIKFFHQLEKGSMPKVKGIIVHQTGNHNANQTFNSFDHGKHGTHFLIAKNGTIYQTALLTQQTNHVGPIKLRCEIEKLCEKEDKSEYYKYVNDKKYGAASLYEQKTKDVPSRYPANKDAVGVELVGMYHKKRGHDVYDKVTKAQNASLKWLVEELRKTFSVPASEVFTHPQVSRKNKTEASTARW